jgi:demethylmenaquinone methyltransferase / 2-methoxy-6-polyprenyl-1,4-benzoquinol methylase
MFDRIADRYDLLNRLMSLGLDRGWRRSCVGSLGLGAGSVLLDVATGTGDLAIEAVRQYPAIKVVGIDPSVEMLRIGREKIGALGLSERIELVEGDAQSIPRDNESFDAVMIAFGIRNVPDRCLALSEFARVVRPGGTVAILELIEPRQGFVAPLARLWTGLMVPALGRVLSGAQEYRYLRDSMQRFPSPPEFQRLLEAAGLVPVAHESLGFGSCHLFVATRPSELR